MRWRVFYCGGALATKPRNWPHNPLNHKEKAPHLRVLEGLCVMLSFVALVPAAGTKSHCISTTCEPLA
jgi:hypothetical protein